MKRWTADETFLAIATVLSKRSTCLDKQVGCVLVNATNKILATGYNGAPVGYIHCIDTGYCSKEYFESDKKCLSAHAEQNALIQCVKPEEIHTAYLTLSPCLSCVKMLLNTGCQRIVFLKKHRHPEAKLFWRGEWVHYEKNLPMY